RVVARRRLQRAVEVVQRGHQALEDRGRRVRRGLLPVPLDALPVVLELRPLAQDLLAQLVALAPEGLDLIAGERRHGGRVHAGEPSLFAALVPRRGGHGHGFVRTVVLASLHGRRSSRAWARDRATWSTSDMTRAYSMRVEPRTPRPQPVSPSR